YKLQVGFRQNPWTGGFGIFFGGIQEPGDAGPVLRYQVLDLRDNPNVRPQRLFLTRGLGTITPRRENTPLTGHVGFTSQNLPRPPDNHEQRLEIEVNRRDGLARVRWENAEFPDLSLPEFNLRCKPGDYLGEFGVFCNGDFVAVISARFMSL